MGTTRKWLLAVTASAAGVSPAMASTELLAAAFDGTLRQPAPAVAQRFQPPVAARSAQDELLALADDRDPAVRAEAAKALKAYVLYDHRVESKLLDMLTRGEPDAVRREALKSLAWAAQHWSTRDAILKIAKSEAETVASRALACKALYVVAGREWNVRDELLELADDAKPAAIRAGAVWALAGATGDYKVSQALVRLAEDRGESAAIRADAIKSLFHNLPTRSEIQSLDERLASDTAAPVEVREAAVLSLVLLNLNYGTQRVLEGLSRDGPPRVRTAAIKALGSYTLEIARYFHAAYYRGEFIDPLENQ